MIKLEDCERQLVECWTRVMGYFRPMSQFNNGKQSEFNERVWFTEDKAMKGKDCGKRKQNQEAAS